MADNLFQNHFRLFLAFCIFFVVWLVVKSLGDEQKKQKHYHSELSEWLEKHHISEYTDKFYTAGIKSLDECVSLNVKDHATFADLSSHELDKIKNAVALLNEEKQLETWLQKRGLTNYLSSLKVTSVENLSSLSKLTDKDLQRLTQQDWSLKDYINFKKGIAALKLQEKNDLWGRLSYYLFNCSSNFNIVCLLVTVVVGFTIMLLSGSLPWMWLQPAPNTKTRILDFFTGKYPAPQSCKVTWDWKEPEVVGKTMTFTIQMQSHKRKESCSPVPTGINL